MPQDCRTDVRVLPQVIPLMAFLLPADVYCPRHARMDSPGCLWSGVSERPVLPCVTHKTARNLPAHATCINVTLHPKLARGRV